MFSSVVETQSARLCLRQPLAIEPDGLGVGNPVLQLKTKKLHEGQPVAYSCRTASDGAKGGARRRRPEWPKRSNRSGLGKPVLPAKQRLARQTRTRPADHHLGPRLLEVPHSEAGKKFALDHTPKRSKDSCIMGGNLKSWRSFTESEMVAYSTLSMRRLKRLIRPLVCGDLRSV